MVKEYQGGEGGGWVASGYGGLRCLGKREKLMKKKGERGEEKEVGGKERSGWGDGGYPRKPP